LYVVVCAILEWLGATPISVLVPTLTWYVVTCAVLYPLVRTPIPVLAPTLTWYVLPSCRPLMVVLVDPLPGSIAVV
jgi:hypothetical protein